MEAQLEDIRSGTTLKSLDNLKECIIDCTRNIKSNDATFQISSLPVVGPKIMELMDGYIETVQRINSAQEAFLKLHEQIESQDDGEQNEEYTDLIEFEQKFHEIMENYKDCQTVIMAREAKKKLEKIIFPEEEDILIEAPAQQIPKDPISKRDVQFAVKSTVCGHIYDKEVILEYIEQKGQSKKKAQCPQAGCTNKNMKKTELVDDEKINNLIQSL